MAKKKEVKVIVEDTESAPSNPADVFLNYAVQKQIKAADVPPRKRLDISFSDASKIGDKKSKTNQEAYEKAHGKLYDMTHNNTIPWRNYVVYLVLLTMLTCCFTYSKYVSNGSGISTFSVATFNYSITGTVEGVSVTNNKMNTSPKVVFDDASVTQKTYTLTVTNNSDVTVNVTPTAANMSPFKVSLKNVTGSTNAAMTNGAPFTLAPNAKRDIQIIIDSSAVTTESTANMTFTFYVEQAE